MSRLLGFDGVRAIACLLVIFHHAFQRLLISEQPDWIKFFETAFLTTAPAGVSVFFVLSGALLAIPFWSAYFDQRAMPSIKEYIKRRAARIMPGFYLALTVCFIFELTVLPNVPQYSLWRYLAGLTFTSGFHYITFFPSEINGPFWSISFEVFSYCLLPIFMAGLFFFLKKRSFQLSIGYWLGVLALILAVNGLVLEYFQTDTVNKGWQYGILGGAKYWMPNYNPVGFFAHYLIGILTAGFLVGLEKNQALREKLSQKNWFDYIAGFGLLVFFSILWTQRMTEDFGFSWQHQPYYYPYLALSIGTVLAVVPYTKCIGKLLDNRFFKFTAKVSFGLYIWHQFIMEFYGVILFPDYFVFKGHFFGRWLGETAVAVGTAYLIASLSWYFLEQPILDWAHNKPRRALDKPAVKTMLKTTAIIILCGIFMTNPALYTATEEAASLPKGNGKLQVEITGLHNTNGQILLSIYNSPQGFPLEKAFLERKISPITGTSLVAIFDDIPYGVYAITVTHDENSNGTLDMNGNMPAEGFGLSKNPNGRPDFSTAKFIIKDPEVKETIKMNYFQ